MHWRRICRQPVCVAVGEPILLVDNSGLLDNQTKYLKKADVKDVYLIGGSDVVKSKIATAMKEYDQDGKVEGLEGIIDIKRL